MPSSAQNLNTLGRIIRWLFRCTGVIAPLWLLMYLSGFALIFVAGWGGAYFGAVGLWIFVIGVSFGMAWFIFAVAHRIIYGKWFFGLK